MDCAFICVSLAATAVLPRIWRDNDDCEHISVCFDRGEHDDIDDHDGLNEFCIYRAR
jgi:hypothetical protein